MEVTEVELWGSGVELCHVGSCVVHGSGSIRGGIRGQGRSIRASVIVGEDILHACNIRAQTSGPTRWLCCKRRGGCPRALLHVAAIRAFFTDDDGDAVVDGGLVRWGWLGGGRRGGEGTPCCACLSHREQELVRGCHRVHVTESLAPTCDEAPRVAHNPIRPASRRVTNDRKPELPRGVDEGLNCKGRWQGM